MKRALAVLAVLLAVSCSDARAAREWNTKGIEADKAREKAAAVQAYGEAARLDPTVPEYHTNLGYALGRSGEYDAALLEFERALTLRPGFTPASHGLTMCRAAIEGRQAAAFQR